MPRSIRDRLLIPMPRIFAIAVLDNPCFRRKSETVSQKWFNSEQDKANASFHNITPVYQQCNTKKKRCLQTKCYHTPIFHIFSEKLFYSMNFAMVKFHKATIRYSAYHICADSLTIPPEE